jgi:multiple sugar transport system substrate-binding protein
MISKGNPNLNMLFICLISLLIILVACTSEVSNAGQQGDENGNNQLEDGGVSQTPEEVTLVLSFAWGEERFQAQFKEPIEEAFPHITLEMLPYDVPDLEEPIAQGQFPDLVWVDDPARIPVLHDFGLDQPLDEWVEQYDVDLSRVNPEYLDVLRTFDEENQLWALPVNYHPWVLHYNKDVFDRFGVDYPTDGMYWHEVIDLAAQVSGELDGVEYRGLEFGTFEVLRQFSVNETDPVTGEVLFTKEEGFEQTLRLVEQLVNIPGNFIERDMDEDNFRKYDEGEAAMLTLWNASLFFCCYDGLEHMRNVDVVSWPFFEEVGEYVMRPTTNLIAASPTTEHPRAVMDVMKFMLSEEYQSFQSRPGAWGATVLLDEEIQAEYGADLEGFQENINMDAFFKYAHAPFPERWSRWNPYAELDWFDFATQHYVDGIDPVQYLRMAEEEAQTNVNEAILSQ